MRGKNMAVDLSKVNYILLKSDGSVLAQSMDYYIQQGSNGVDKIFFGCQAAQNTDVGQAICTLPNGQQNTLIGEWDTCTYNNETIGGFLFTLGTSQTNYKGGLMMSLAIYRSNKRLVNYPLYLVINETGLMSDTDTGVTIEEINTYLRQVQEMIKMENGIVVMENISTADLEEFKTGQLFFDKYSQQYYEKIATSPYYQLVENGHGILASKRVFPRYVIDDLDIPLGELYNLVGERVCLINESLICHLKMTISGYKVVLNDFKNRKYYDVDVTGDSTTLLEILNGDAIQYVDKTNTANQVYGTASNGTQKTFTVDNTVGADGNIVRRASGTSQIMVPLIPTANGHASSKKYVDDLIASIKTNAFILVDTSVYETLSSFLESTGEEGYIYLYPVDTGDLSKGYQQYIWESSEWLYIGNTQLDLSNYYTKSQVDTIANGKVDKTSSASKVYGTNASGNQTTISFTSSNNGSTIPLRNNDGNIGVSLTPTDNTHAASKKYVDDHASTYYVPYTGATSNVNLGTHTLYANDVRAMSTFTLATSFNFMAIQNEQWVIRTPLDIVLYSQLGKVYYNDEEVATKDYVDDSIAAAIATTYRPMGSKTVAQLNAMTSSELEAGYVYNVLDTGTLTAGNLDVFAGENVAWIVEGGVGRWDKYGAEIDWSAYDEKFMAAGFFEVQNYNESTGEITFVYATDLYIMSYNSDTGIMTIEAN